MRELFLQVLVSGLLWGFIYALIALGLTLIYGMMDIVNFAHGDFLMLGMYGAFWFSIWPGVDPLVSLPVIAILMAGVGFLAYNGLVKHVLKAPMFAQMVSTFGLMLFLRGLAQFLWKPDYRSVSNPMVSGVWKVAGIALSKPQLVAALGAVIVTSAVYLFITRTRTGWAMQAVAQDREAAALMGISVQKSFTLAWMIGAACVGIAGALLSEFYYVFPSVGGIFASIALATVALGGFGSIEGAFIAGLIMGIVEALAGFLLAPVFKPVFIFMLYLMVVLLRPRGLMGKA